MLNPLFSDRDVDFLLYEVLDAGFLPRLPRFAEHSRETFDAYVGVCRRFAREVLLPAYRELDAEGPRLSDGRVLVHERMHEIWPRMRELGVITASRPFEVGGQQLPLTIATAAHLYLMAGVASAYSYAGLTTGAAHLIEAFGSDDLKRTYMEPLYEGRWTGTMALTEPQAGSSLADVATRAVPFGDHYLVSGSKMFISGGDHDLTENIVHLALARIDGAPAGVKGISLFVVPKMRPAAARSAEPTPRAPGGAGGGAPPPIAAERGLVPNDVRVAGLIHKIGWRPLPSVALSLGDAGDCHGFLVGEPHQGLSYMFQMMNAARIGVGADAVAIASVAYHESLDYARQRAQGRPLSSRDPRQPPVPIVEHADVRRLLLRQKAIVEGGTALILTCAELADLSEHAAEEGERQRAQGLLDLLTPIAKSFPAERGFESNVLAIQVLGGYGYSSEFRPEAWMRDQKLSSIHEGTTGIHGLDLLGRKVVAQGGAALKALLAEVESACARAEGSGVEAAWVGAVRAAGASLASVTGELARRGAAGDPEGMLRHSADYLEAVSTYVVAWGWLRQAAAALEGRRAGRHPEAFVEGKLAAAQYYLATELPRVQSLLELCRANEDSYARMKPEWF